MGQPGSQNHSSLTLRRSTSQSVSAAPHPCFPLGMGLLQILGLCALAACCGVVSVPQPFLKDTPLLSRNCNDSDVLSVSGFALQDINRDQKDGYVLSLNRVSRVWEHTQDHLGSVFYLVLDVLQTGCHVLSKKAWQDCAVRTLHTSVYGQCKALFYINKPRRILYSIAYNCTLRPVSRRKIHSKCPDCPSPSRIDKSDPRVLEAAVESLAKFNRESTSKQYSLVKVTKATSQWMGSLAYFVEYLIQESPCTKSQAGSCSLQPSDSPVGLCKGTLIQNPLEKRVTVTCDFFEQQAPAPGTESLAGDQGPSNLPNVEELQQKITPPTDTPSKVLSTGIVQHLPDLDDEKPEGSQGEGPPEAFPVQLELTTNPQGELLDVSFLFLEPIEVKLVILPFPKEDQHSGQCPGPAQNFDPLILPP
uniref:Fetuin B n=1 Tax=Oryctolagus cuniculus TaxID=9986 RepID=G1SEK8_RABIT